MQLHAKYEQCNCFTTVSWDIKLNANLVSMWPFRDNRKCTRLVGGKLLVYAIGWEQKENSFKERWRRTSESSLKTKKFYEEKGRGFNTGDMRGYWIPGLDTASSVYFQSPRKFRSKESIHSVPSGAKAGRPWAGLQTKLCSWSRIHPRSRSTTITRHISTVIKDRLATLDWA